MFSRLYRRGFCIVFVAGLCALAFALAIEPYSNLPATAAQAADTATIGAVNKSSTGKSKTSTGSKAVGSPGNTSGNKSPGNTSGNKSPGNTSSNKSPGNSSGNSPVSTIESEVNAVAEPPMEDGQQKQPKAVLTIRLTVPQMLKRTDIFSLNPYTTAPPKVAIPVAPLPEKAEALKSKIINSGYNARLSMTKAYPNGGIRWHYAYDRARKRSGIGEPHVFFQMYHFADDLCPYVIPECKRINKIEEQRNKTYFALRDSYLDNHKDEEMEALRLGLEPIKLDFNPIKRGDSLETSLYVSPGEWWITGSHRVPGLIYFWQEPIKLHDGDNVVVDLKEDNAILVQGGW